MTIRMTVDTRKLDKLTKEMMPKAERIVKETAFKVEGRAKVNAPVDTGNLRSSIQTIDGDNELQKIVNVGANYGIHQEYGTYEMAAHPFLIPAVEKFRQEFIKRWKELFE